MIIQETLSRVGLQINTKDLVDGHYYAGVCRHAYIARWSAKHGQFFHWREKFGKTFIEDIEPWQDGHVFDEFVPVFDLGPHLPAPITIPDEQTPSPGLQP